MAAIVDFEVRLPSGHADVRDMQQASGLALAEILEITHAEQFPVLDEYETAWELAAEAAGTVLKRSGVPPADVDLVLYAGSGEWDRPFWSPAARVAAELGIERAHCFEVSNFCNAAMTAVQLAADKVSLGRARHALVLIGDRLSQLVDYQDPESKALFNFGDAPAAVLVGRDGPLELLHSQMRTEPEWADYYSGDIEDDRVVMRRRGHRRGLGDAYLRNFVELTNDTLFTLDLAPADVRYFLINQGDRNMHERVLEALGIAAQRSVFNYHRYGHMGGSDPFIALGQLMDEGRLSPGDVVLVASSGMGFSWGVTALRRS
ncbi:3-oxoacyl-ACP synthase III family protein [Micromonospora chokoriensis]|uniref:3-oxoacyl-ACP synthase III family protein n=1 Tax=Micromonospora chokoriensis TaxID=356851 RepID=UPI0004C343C4|nr:3-oxoacyl-[acyl-carrier-protein] synthase III C-terminal domain-containing protein [Micromonospora chokoriensis]